LRRTLADFSIPELKTFLTPSDAVIDGRTEEWRNAPELTVPEAEALVPLHAEARPGGEAIPRVSIRAGWTTERLWLALETEDDCFVPPEPGAPPESGDSIKIIADSQGAKYMLTAALTSGRTAVTERYGVPGDERRPQAVVRRRMQGSAGGLSYELSIPWETMRMTPTPGAEIRLGVVVYDNDGDGVRGAWEWGAGATAPTPVPRWFGRLRLLDASRERAARYRKIAAALVGEPESAQYLERALLCLSEEEAAKERKAGEVANKIAADKPPATPAERLAKYRAAALELSDINEGRALLSALLRLAGDAKAREEEIEKYLAAKPRTAHAGWLIGELQAALGGGRSFERAEEWMRRCQLNRTERRRFYTRFAPTWNSWVVLGPFGGEGAMRGLDAAHGPERGVELRKPILFEEKEYVWTEIKKKKNEESFFNLQSALGPPKELEQTGYCGYAWRKVISVSDRKALLWVGAADIYSAWVNRRQVVIQQEAAPRKDQSVVPITLNRGENEILLAVGVRGGGRLGFYCRVSDEDGRPLDGLTDRFPEPGGKE
jgi:hypothetical protein